MKIRSLPPMLTEIVHTALLACDKTKYSVYGACPACGGTLSGYDSRKRRFAVLREEGEEIPVEVILQRSYCSSCGKIVVPEGPFYPKTRIGSPVVDLTRVFAGMMPPGRVAARLGQMGIMVDRGSVREYISGDFPAVPSIAGFGMAIPVTIISLSGLAGSVQENRAVTGEDILAACNFPARYGMGQRDTPG